MEVTSPLTLPRDTCHVLQHLGFPFTPRLAALEAWLGLGAGDADFHARVRALELPVGLARPVERRDPRSIFERLEGLEVYRGATATMDAAHLAALAERLCAARPQCFCSRTGLDKGICALHFGGQMFGGALSARDATAAANGRRVRTLAASTGEGRPPYHPGTTAAFSSCPTPFSHRGFVTGGPLALAASQLAVALAYKATPSPDTDLKLRSQDYELQLRAELGAVVSAEAMGSLLTSGLKHASDCIIGDVRGLISTPGHEVLARSFQLWASGEALLQINFIVDDTGALEEGCAQEARAVLRLAMRLAAVSTENSLPGSRWRSEDALLVVTVKVSGVPGLAPHRSTVLVGRSLSVFFDPISMINHAHWGIRMPSVLRAIASAFLPDEGVRQQDAASHTMGTLKHQGYPASLQVFPDLIVLRGDNLASPQGQTEDAAFECNSLCTAFNLVCGEEGIWVGLFATRILNMCGCSVTVAASISSAAHAAARGAFDSGLLPQLSVDPTLGGSRPFSLSPVSEVEIKEMKERCKSCSTHLTATLKTISDVFGPPASAARLSPQAVTSQRSFSVRFESDHLSHTLEVSPDETYSVVWDSVFSQWVRIVITESALFEAPGTSDAGYQRQLAQLKSHFYRADNALASRDHGGRLVLRPPESTNLASFRQGTAGGSSAPFLTVADIGAGVGMWSYHAEQESAAQKQNVVTVLLAEPINALLNALKERYPSASCIRSIADLNTQRRRGEEINIMLISMPCPPFAKLGSGMADSRAEATIGAMLAVCELRPCASILECIMGLSSSRLVPWYQALAKAAGGVVFEVVLYGEWHHLPVNGDRVYLVFLNSALRHHAPALKKRMEAAHTEKRTSLAEILRRPGNSAPFQALEGVVERYVGGAPGAPEAWGFLRMAGREGPSIWQAGHESSVAQRPRCSSTARGALGLYWLDNSIVSFTVQGACELCGVPFQLLAGLSVDAQWRAIGNIAPPPSDRHMIGTIIAHSAEEVEDWRKARLISPLQAERGSSCSGDHTRTSFAGSRWLGPRQQRTPDGGLISRFAAPSVVAPPPLSALVISSSVPVAELALHRSGVMKVTHWICTRADIGVPDAHAELTPIMLALGIKPSSVTVLAGPSFITLSDNGSVRVVADVIIWPLHSWGDIDQGLLRAVLSCHAATMVQIRVLVDGRAAQTSMRQVCACPDYTMRFEETDPGDFGEPFSQPGITFVTMLLRVSFITRGEVFRLPLGRESPTAWLSVATSLGDIMDKVEGCNFAAAFEADQVGPRGAVHRMGSAPDGSPAFGTSGALPLAVQLVDCDGTAGAAALGITIVETRITTKLGLSLMRKAKVGELALAMGWDARVASALASYPGPKLQCLLWLSSPKKFGTHHALMLAAHLHPSLACAYEASVLGSSAAPLPTSGGERYTDEISTLAHVPARRMRGDSFVTEGRLIISVDGSTIEIQPGATAVVMSAPPPPARTRLGKLNINRGVNF